MTAATYKVATAELNNGTRVFADATTGEAWSPGNYTDACHKARALHAAGQPNRVFQSYKSRRFFIAVEPIFADAPAKRTRKEPSRQAKAARIAREAIKALAYTSRQVSCRGSLATHSTALDITIKTDLPHEDLDAIVAIAKRADVRFYEVIDGRTSAILASGDNHR